MPPEVTSVQSFVIRQEMKKINQPGALFQSIDTIDQVELQKLVRCGLPNEIECHSIESVRCSSSYYVCKKGTVP